MEAVVDFEYKAEQEDELTLKVGDIITNVQTAEGGWWEGELNGKKGMFPENFVKLVNKRRDAPSKKEEKREAAQRKSVRELANKFKDGVPMGAPKKKDGKKRCKVLFEYKKENDDELELAVGDIVEFHKQVEEGWWEGSLNGKHGVFPSNFVQMIEEPVAEDSAAVSEEKEKAAPTEPSNQGKEDFHTIKGKKVIGVGLGNIFGGGPIKLRSTGTDNKKEETVKESPKPNKKPEPDPMPEAAKREKQNTLERAVVRFSYAADQPDELSLVEGQIVKIIERELEDEGWWKGELNGKVGVFPDNFVELLPPEEPSKPKKPPPPSAAAKQNFQPKLPEKSAVGDSDEKIKTEHPSAGSMKKGIAPPPIGKKPVGQKSMENKSEPASVTRPTAPTKESKPTLHKENHTEDAGGEDFDGVESGGQKLVHLTANRARGPKKRPPSTVLTLNEGDKENDVGEDVRDTKKSPAATQEKPPHKPAKEPQKESKQQPYHDTEAQSIGTTHVVHHAPPHTTPALRDVHSSGPPPRPPEPSSAPPSHHAPPIPTAAAAAPHSNATSAANAQTIKLLEQLQRELNELKANSVSKAAFKELQAEHEKLKTEFDTLRNHHSKKLRELMNEVDDEKKLRLTTQVEIERVKKLMAETNV